MSANIKVGFIWGLLIGVLRATAIAQEVSIDVRLPQVGLILHSEAAIRSLKHTETYFDSLYLQCDPLKELQKQTDVTLTVAVWSTLGLVNHLPAAGLTIYMPSDIALENLMKLIGASHGSRSLAETWPTIPATMQTKIISIFINHVTYTVNASNLNGNDVTVPTALSFAHPGFALTLSNGGRKVKTPAKQTVNVGEARMVCGNFLHVSPQILMPSSFLTLPDTSLEQALAIGREMAGGATAHT